MKPKSLFLTIIAGLLLIEGLSFVGYAVPGVTTIAAIAVLGLTLLVSIKNPVYGFIILLLELLVGSQGYLLYVGIGDRLPLRIGLWIIVLVVWLVREGRELKRFNMWAPLTLLATAIAFAALNGFWDENDISLVFIEAKRWAYLAFLIPFVLAFCRSSDRKTLVVATTAGIAWISLKSLFFLYVFSHGLGIGEPLYSWTRENLLGEITRLPNGFYRVFLQSQVFALIGLFFGLAIFLKTTAERWAGLLAAVSLAVIILSLSRSFWVGTALAGLGFLLLSPFFLSSLRQQKGVAIGKLALVASASFILLSCALLFPIPRPLFGLDASLLKDRATEFEAGAASRWALLPVMWESIKTEPITGQGLGKSLTYITSDPRILESSPSGEYTTSAFEWGWLDIWLKLGILGLGAYIWVIMALGRRLWALRKPQPALSLAGLSSLAALVILHFFTPYLNHPLGFGYMALLFVLAETEGEGLA